VTKGTPRLVAHALIVIPVKVNQQGPFDFMVDTGSQVTVVDPSLAAELSLKPRGTVGLVSTASYAHASISVLDSLEAGFKTIEHPANGARTQTQLLRRQVCERQLCRAQAATPWSSVIQDFEPSEVGKNRGGHLRHSGLEHWSRSRLSIVPAHRAVEAGGREG
jgi:Aspartyl protease